MLASYLHNFIFIKTKKTGGTTAEVTLGASCGPADIVTPLGPKDELLRGNGKPICRNFSSDSTIEQGLRDAIIRGDNKAYLMARKRCEFFSHMTATEIKAKVAPEFWEGAYRMTVERHPYEKAVSAAYFKYRPRIDKPFSDYLEDFLHEGSYSTYRFYTIDNKPVVHEFLRQETLYDDLTRAGAKLGIPIPEKLARMKTSSRRDIRPAREILTDSQKQIVQSFCKNEFDLLGYDP
jgi:hypothetical protein